MTNEVCIEMRNLSKTFHISEKGFSFKDKILDLVSNRHKMTVKALDNVNLQIHKGEFLGIIGRNGSGKSTLLKIILGAVDPDRGSYIKTRGKIVRLALGNGFDLNLSARDNIYLNGAIFGLSFKEIGEKFHEILHFAELERFVNTPVKFYSSGMRSRLSFAIALHVDADIYLIDEFFADVGDEIFKEKSQKAFENKILKGKTIVHVSHSMDTIKDHCDKVLVLDKGKGTFFNDVFQAIEMYESKFDLRDTTRISS